MSMEHKVPTRNLERCPQCRSRRLVVAVYQDRLDPSPRYREMTLECEGCCSVVEELDAQRPAAEQVSAAVLHRKHTR